MDLIQKIYARVDDFVLTTDIMVGFPGESHEQFENTAQLLLETQPYKLHIFPYSPREGTRAARYQDLIGGSEVKFLPLCNVNTEYFLLSERSFVIAPPAVPAPITT